MFCEECSSPLARTCSNCGSPLSATAKFCAECAHAAEGAARQSRFAAPESYTPKHLAEKILTSKSALEGEHKQVTVLFCDLVGSTELAERLGAESMHRLLSLFFDLALAEVHRYEGTINQFLGDGFMALFGAPLAHEDHARRAALAALGLQRILRERPTDFGVPPGTSLAVRMGLNTGHVVVGAIGDNLRMDYTAVGDTTNLAARLQQLAEPGTICLSEGTQIAIRRYFGVQHVGERTVKGKPEPITVYKLLGPRATPGSSNEVISVQSRLVGRVPEVAEFTACIEHVLSGRGGIVTVTAEAGLGKSRLVAELRRQYVDRDVRWLEGRALSFSRTMSYLPFLEIVKDYAGINEHDGEDESWAKLERQITGLFPEEVAEVLPYLATLLSLEVRAEYANRVKYLDAQAMGGQIFRASRRFFERLAYERPLILVFEDWHWADQSSAGLLEHLLPLVEIAPLLICCINRPDADSPAAQLRGVARDKHAGRYTDIVLSPLDGAESVRLVENLLAIDERSSRLRELVLSKAEGNPFFMEELVRSLIAMKAVVQDEATGRWRAIMSPEEISLPETIHGVIMARIDRLEESLKQVLRLAAVVGRSFLYRVLKAIAEGEQELDGHLAGLQRIDMIRERRRLPELEYLFKHALLQEATYQSILTDRRRELHRQVALCIESLFADRLDEFASLLAYHYARAESWEKAQEYLFKAGDEAGRVAADSEALTHYEQAVVAHERAFGDRWDSVKRATLECKVGAALFRRGNHTAALTHLEHALRLLGHQYPQSQTAIASATLKQLIVQLGHRLMAPLSRLTGGAPPEAIADERWRIYEALAWIDYFVNQRRYLLDALTLLNSSERVGHRSGIVVGAMGTGTVCDVLSLRRIAQSYHHRAVTAAEQSGSPLSMGLALLGLACHEYYRGQWAAAFEHYERGAELYWNAGELRGWGATLGMLFHLCLHQGKFAECMDQARKVLRAGQEGGDYAVLAWGLQMSGIIYRELGRFEGGGRASRKGGGDLCCHSRSRGCG